MLELMLSLTLSAIVAVPLGTILWQVNIQPAETSAEVTEEVQVRNVGIAIPDDSRAAQLVNSGSDPVWARFAWAGFTGSSAIYHSVIYAWSSGDGSMVRDESVDGILSESLIISRFLDSFSAASVVPRNDLSPFLVETAVSPEVDSPVGSEVERSSTLSFLRAPVAPLDPAGGYALLSLGDIEMKGNKNTIIGDVHANGEARIWCNGNRVAGLSEAAGGVVLKSSSCFKKNDDDDDGSDLGVAADFELLNGAGATKLFPVTFSLGDFPLHFTFDGDVDLDKEDDVWIDPDDHKLLKPGIYYATGTLKIDKKDVQGQLVTLIANDIELKDKNARLTPHPDAHGVVIFATGADSKGRAVDIKKEGLVLNGIIYAPNGEVKIDGKEFFLDGSIFSNGFEWHDTRGRIAYDPDLFES